jgi:regulation of enolase protein 1 (concanavalin A-like superfamily)
MQPFVQRPVRDAQHPGRDALVAVRTFQGFIDQQPRDWNAADGTRLTLTASELTDVFVDPSGARPVDNMPSALFAPPDPSFLLSARVAVGFASTYDAGVIQLWEREDVWAKLCFEYSPQKQPMVVSVVTRGTSDDCNSAVINGREVCLRLAHTAASTAFHYSLDGRYWHLVRYFSLGTTNNLLAGFSSQSPTGRKCTAVFSEISYRPGTLKDIRTGE